MKFDFNKSPFIVFWEVTQACDLACRHCRAVAMPDPHPRELSTEEGKRLIDRVAEFEIAPILIFTGGDPLKRDDIYELIEYGVGKQLRVAMSPSGTPLVTKDRLKRLFDAGLRRVSFSLEGSNRYIHDSFRGVKGSFDYTINGIKWAVEVGITVQVNTTITKWNYGDLENMAEFISKFDVVMWDLFFLVPTGRATLWDMISPSQFEEAFERIYAISQKYSFTVKTTAATHYRRFQIQQMEKSGRSVTPADVKGAFRGEGNPHHAGFTTGVTDGRGIMFISKTGDIFPSGFLPVRAGNVREDDLIEVYQKSEIFTDLRDPSRLKGKCGQCSFKEICGGSRARAYGITGDYLAEEPYCIHVPEGFDFTRSLAFQIERGIFPDGPAVRRAI